MEDDSATLAEVLSRCGAVFKKRKRRGIVSIGGSPPSGHYVWIGLNDTSCDRCQQYFASTAVYIHQTFAGCCRADQGLAGAFDGEV